MCKPFLLTVILGFLLGACSGSKTPEPTATHVLSPTQELKGTEPRLITEIKLETQTGTAYSLDWSPDGKTLAAASGSEITLISEDFKVVQAVLQPKGGALGVAWGSDQNQFATVNGYRNPMITLWDWDRATDQLARARQIQASSDQYGVSWSPDGKMLATLADDRKSTIQIWDTGTWEELHKFELPYTNPRRALHWNADNGILYGAGESRSQIVVFALNVTDGSVQEVANFSRAAAEVFAFSPDAKKLAVADARGVVQLLSVTSGEILTGFKSVDQPVDLAWNPNGGTLAILDYKTKLQLWEIAPQKNCTGMIL